MPNRYLLPIGAASGLLLLAIGETACAQAISLATLSPAPNAHAVLRTARVVATFNQPLLATSAGALKVFSSQRGGLRGGGTAAVAGNTLTFAPTAYDFRPGETVQCTVTRAVSGAGGALAAPRVSQFTTAVGGTGRGGFNTGSDYLLSDGGSAVVLGDIDGDGDADALVTLQNGNSVAIYRNRTGTAGSASGTFDGPQYVAVGVSPVGVALADVDGDGDLDLLTANFSNSSVSVLQNGGNATGSNTGQFGSPQNVPLGGYPRGIVLGDVDGDGDLDLLAANSTTNQVNVRLNGGDAMGSNTGQFANGTDVPVDQSPQSVALADVDNDGDLDLLTANGNSATVSLRLNGGDATGSNTGTFGAGRNIPAGTAPRHLAVGDVDGDGDLDVVAASASASFVRLYLNGGNASGTNVGQFGPDNAVPVAGTVGRVMLADVDADGDLDLIATSTNSNLVSVRLNGGNATGSNTGQFANGLDAVVRDPAIDLALADVDGDADLDMVTTAYIGTSMSAMLNNGTGPLATTTNAPAPAALACYPNPATGRVHLLLPAPAHAELFDAMGRMVRMAPAQAGAATLDVAGLSPGLYLVRAAGQVARLLVE